MESSEQEPKPIEVVAAVIFNKRQDSLLIGKRAQGKKFAGKWEFVGGKVEQGEDIKQAIIREMNEEIGLAVEPTDQEIMVEHDYGKDIGHFRIHFVECQPVGSVVLRKANPEVYEEVRWFKITQAPKLDWLEADRDFVEKLAVMVTTPQSGLN